MTPPAAMTEAAPHPDAPAPETDPRTSSGETPASRPALVVLRKRADFVAASKARRTARPGLNLQARKRPADESAQGARVGFTCSKKVGNAVARNRAKRRLRAAAAEILPGIGRAGWDYVLIGRPDTTAARPWDALLEDLRDGIAQLHEGRSGHNPR
jgi:ribonuclease P protein component